MMKSVGAFCLALSLLASCGGDDPNTGNTAPAVMTNEQALILASEILNAELIHTPSDAKLAARALEITQSFGPVTADCAISGTVELNGTRSDTSTGTPPDPITFTFSKTFTTAYHACTFAGRDGNNYTMEGTLDRTNDGSGTAILDGMTVVSANISSTVTVTGTLSVTGGALDITECAIDLVFAITTTTNNDTTTSTVNAQGSICGIEIDASPVE